MDSRRFCQLFFCLVAFELAPTAVLNLAVDPFGQYSTAWVEPIIAPSRRTKLEFLEQQTVRPEGLILGSSRVLKIDPEYLQNRTNLSFYNAGVNNGRPVDWLAMIRHYDQVWGRFPKVVVIGVDIVAFTIEAPEDARILSEPRFASLVPEHVTMKDEWNRFADLFSQKQTISSLRSVANCFSKTMKSSASEQSEASEIDLDEEEIRDDGLVLYHRRCREMKLGTYDLESSVRFNTVEHDLLFREFKTLSIDNLTMFANLVRLLRANECQVYFFLTPYHPDVQDHLETIGNFRVRKQESIQFLTMLGRSDGLDVR